MTSTALADRLRKSYSGAVFDALRERGIADTILPADIRPVDDTLVMAGPVFPVKGSTKSGISADDSLMSWTGLLSAAPSGHVVVCDGATDDIALMGELSAETLQHRGIAGYLTNGGCRDSAFIRSIGFPVFHRFYTPRDVVGKWSVDEMNIAIEIGGVPIAPGDYLIADIDGAVVIPGDVVEEITEDVEKVMTTENELREDIRRGTDPQEAYLKYRRF